ncbi:hypothetical protein [Celeribacter naphthalenivorans]|uniref:hypothetical protein n=1 Tax=Celeribacter naphthalenivorans TaxID=1614694 RepID=UPI001CFA32C0|nr:hypothetical protein [Celeribacter naphthalenivorans]
MFKPLYEAFKAEGAPNIDNVVWVTVSAGFTMFGLLLTFRSNHIELLEALDKNDGLLKVTRFQTSEDVNAALLARIGSAKQVKNTYFPNLTNARVDGREAMDIRKLYEKWLSGNAEVDWFDVVTPEEVFDKRFVNLGQGIDVKIIKNTPFMSSVIRTLAPILFC